MCDTATRKRTGATLLCGDNTPGGKGQCYGGRAYVHTPSSCSQVSTRHGCHMCRCHENRNRGTTFSSAACGGSSKEQVRGGRFWDPLKTMAGLDISFRLTPELWLLSLLSVAATATSLFPKGALLGSQGRIRTVCSTCTWCPMCMCTPLSYTR